MSTVRLIYCRSLTIGGILIRAAQWWDQWCHCGIIMPDNTVINAQAFKGVTREPLDQFLKRYSAYQIVTCNVPSALATYKYAESQIGSGYDYGALVAFITGKLGIRASSDKHQCVGLVERSLAAGGRHRFRTDLNKVTPYQSYKVV
jgi:hypothetical protein